MVSPNKIKAKRNAVASPNREADSFAELRFITELGRSLLAIHHPKKVAASVVSSIQEATNNLYCAIFAELDGFGLLTCCCDVAREDRSDLLNKKRLHEWLEFLPSAVSYLQDDPEDFFLSGNHKAEYVSPILIGNKVKGAVVAAFEEKRELSESKRRLIDAATQMAAMSIGLSASNEGAINLSVNIARQEQQKFTDAILDALPVSLYVIDKEYRVVAWNRHREIGILGLPREDVIGRNIFDILTKQPRQRLQIEFERAFRTGKIERIEQHTTDENGQMKHWLISKVPMREHDSDEVTHVITVGEDITMRVEAMHAIARADKLSAVGRLAAGVVHEINNPLATISACAEALELRVFEGTFGDSPDVVDLKEYLGLIRSESFRCKSITNGLLDFSRVRSGNRESVDIGEVLRSSSRLLTHQKRGDNIIIDVDVKDAFLLVDADEGQLQQAIIALATNAIDAMPDGGTLTFHARRQNNRIVIEVRDTGIGISPENLPKIFEPFFTTKEVGRGTGLGLAVCYGIITEHGGRLSVRSNPGSGTSFSIFLPGRKENSQQ